MSEEPRETDLEKVLLGFEDRIHDLARRTWETKRLVEDKQDIRGACDERKRLYDDIRQVESQTQGQIRGIQIRLDLIEAWQRGHEASK